MHVIADNTPKGSRQQRLLLLVALSCFMQNVCPQGYWKHYIHRMGLSSVAVHVAGKLNWGVHLQEEERPIRVKR